MALHSIHLSLLTGCPPASRLQMIVNKDINLQYRHNFRLTRLGTISIRSILIEELRTHSPPISKCHLAIHLMLAAISWRRSSLTSRTLRRGNLISSSHSNNHRLQFRIKLCNSKGNRIRNILQAHHLHLRDSCLLQMRESCQTSLPLLQLRQEACQKVD
jgi:hypothetical protein